MTRMVTTASISLDSDTATATLKVEEGSWVTYGNDQVGIVVAVEDGPLEWPVTDENLEEVGDEGETVYVVARQSGGSKPFTADEIEPEDRDAVMQVDDVDDDDIVADEPLDDIDDAEMARGYMMPDEAVVTELHEVPLAELLNVPGVEDPGIGFDSWPDSWRNSEKPARLIALDAWTSMGATFRGCVAEIGSRRLCAAFKDEILGTERWRNRF